MPNGHKPIGKTTETLQDRYEETMVRLQNFKDAGYKVVSIWRCEFRKLLLQDPGLEKELGSHSYVKNSPINPFSARGPIYRPPLCLRRMREADVSAHFFQALQ